MLSGISIPFSPHVVTIILQNIGRMPVGDYYVYQILFLFFLSSFTGWLLETLYRSCYARRPVNPGVLTGPLVPLYGAGVLVIIFLSEAMAPYPVTMRALGYFVVITILEYITGEILLAFTGRRFWDYTDCRFHLRGHVCLRFSLYWVILAFVFEYTLFPAGMALIGMVPEGGLVVFNTLAIIFIGCDLMFTVTVRRGIITLPSFIDGKLVGQVERFITSLWSNPWNSSIAIRSSRLLRAVVDDLRRRNERRKER